MISVYRSSLERSVSFEPRAGQVSPRAGQVSPRQQLNDLTGDARPRFFESYVITLCSRSRCGAREAMTVGCKPTIERLHINCAPMLYCYVPFFPRTREKRGRITWAQSIALSGIHLCIILLANFKGIFVIMIQTRAFGGLLPFVFV